MSFDKNYFSQMAYGGAGGNSIYHYYTTADNLATLAANTVDPNYFKAAYDTHGIALKAGDVIFGVYRNSDTAASAIVYTVPDNWDSNGASVIYHTKS